MDRPPAAALEVIETKLCLRFAHHHKKSKRLKQTVERLGADVFQLLALFPKVKGELLAEESQSCWSYLISEFSL